MSLWWLCTAVRVEALQWQLRGLKAHEDAFVLTVVWKGEEAWLGGWGVGLFCAAAADVLGLGQPASGDVGLSSWTSSSLKIDVPCLSPLSHQEHLQGK